MGVVSVFASKLVIDSWTPFDDLFASVFADIALVFASKLDTDAWSPFNDLVEDSGT